MKSVDLLHQPPFPDKLSIEKMSKAFKGYARTYKIKMIGSKHPLAWSKAGKSSSKEFLKTY